MKTLTLLTSLVLMLLPSVLLSQKVEDETDTKGWGNGRYWEQLDLNAKNQHLYGIEAGINLFANELFSQSKDDAEWNRTENLRSKLTIAGFRFSDLVQQVDAFYKDRANIRIPVAYAYSYSVKKMSGDSPELLERFLSSLRKQWNR